MLTKFTRSERSVLLLIIIVLGFLTWEMKTGNSTSSLTYDDPIARQALFNYCQAHRLNNIRIISTEYCHIRMIPTVINYQVSAADSSGQKIELRVYWSYLRGKIIQAY